MKAIICFLLLLSIFTSLAFSQSEMNYQPGTGIEVQTGADICADTVIIQGTVSGGGTICGSGLYVLNLTAFIQGFYRALPNTMIGDTVRVYLRNAAVPYAIVDSSKSTLSSSGVGTFRFSNASDSVNYYIVLKHRNSIETWSNVGKVFSSGSLSFDFTTAITKAYGNNMKQIDASPVKFGIYSGDVNQDGVIDGTDVSIIDNNAFNFATGYIASDVTGDNVIDGSDAAIADNNAYNFVAKVTP